MKKTADYELSFHSSLYIHDNLSSLYLAEIPLSVPTTNGAIMINSPELHDPRRIVIESRADSGDLLIARVDGSPLQVIQADNRRDTYGDTLFAEPIYQLGVKCVDRLLWLADIDAENVNDNEMMHEFIGILSTFAAIKQAKLLES